MILISICFISLLFVILNLFLTKNDYLNPAVIFPLLFLIQGIFNIFALTYLELTFHIEVLIILSVSYLIFTIFNFLNLGRKINQINLNNDKIFFMVLNVVLFYLIKKD